METTTVNQAPITGFLRQMKFRKRIIGGVDEEDVLDKIAHITMTYKDLIETFYNQNISLQQDNSLLQNQVEQLKTTVQEKDIQISSLQSEKTSVICECEVLTAKTQEIADTLQRYEQERAALIETAQYEAKKIIQQAMTFAEELAAQKEYEMEQQLSVRQAEIGQLIDHRKAIEKETEELRIRMKANLRIVTEKLCQMLSLTKELDGEAASDTDL